MSVMTRGRLPLAAAAAAALASLASASATADPAPPYRMLLAQTQAAAPRLSEATAAVRQAEGLARQAAVIPNPSASLQTENFNGTGPYKGGGAAETTISLAQLIELGGKRSARISAGRASVDAARARLGQERADYAFDLAAAYADADAADRRQTLAQEGLGLANEDLRAARALVEAGKEAELRRLQAQAAARAAEAEFSAAQVERATAFAKLTALSGSQVPFTSLDEKLLDRPLSVAALNVDLGGIPSVVAAQAERDAAARRVRVEQTRAVPDVTASVGVRRFSADDSTALVAGVSVPIPVFDQNRGAISASRAELAGAEARLNAARLDAQAELSVARAQVDAAQARAAAATEGETTAGEAYRLTRIAYESGKVSLIELITARRAFAEARDTTIEAELARLRAEAGVARLQGRAPFGAQQ